MKTKFIKHNRKVNNFYNNDQEIGELKMKYDSASVGSEVKRFEDMPLSQKTLNGLLDSNYIEATDIQRNGILPALIGKDVMGTAVTGSGKTLAFLVPVIEHLFINKWSRSDGVCAIVISPTRELAYQIFETLKRIGRYHDFSAGLIIGGKNLKYERNRMDQCNILICTPGRLLQHMDENPLFNASTMELLVLDEADRCLDMGFEETLNAIIENFPTERQTLLFSATQTHSVKDIARLNLRDPIFIGSKKDNSKDIIPILLQQNYVVIELADKITVLWSFINNHLKQKMIVFFTSCKQVKYVFEIFCKLRPGTSLLALYGSLHQDRRIAIYNDFTRKSNVVLFATDIASRGLDFPTVNWVVQMDCPEDAVQYIHRAGRTARNKARGESLLVLTPSEESGMIRELRTCNIQIQKIHIDPKKLFSPRLKIEAALAQNTELKASAQRAFLSYIKSVFLMKNKNVFNVFNINFESFAISLGLAVTPRVRFLERLSKKKNSSVSNSLDEPNNFMQDDSDNDDFLSVKRIDHDLVNTANVPIDLPKRTKVLTKAAVAKRAIRKKIKINEKMNFDDEGNVIIDKRRQLQYELPTDYGKNAGGINIEVAKRILSQEDKYDKERFRELVKYRHKKQKDKLKKLADEDPKTDDAYSESDDNVDLTWLPDPDKIYISNPKRAEKREASQINIDDREERTIKKVKFTSELSLNDAELIAAKILSYKA
ncbi:PREDICTED: probable ATP-dependent RNA helicase DDX10 [Rhagoletis zephyria]|uniref:probable ATP-dependent RNA helicase DDX10 n=1 Tax=Rhagoletis zephyria TaxID=28612 RepID=UPI000811577D|nr:PREDICTED: probable ATP-dependent RNA helicase DDX10 [Rhagoletis zephyria]XP_036319755.1 probable ATP-dependent RNA helicase DDX10 [Rhagoletis pomonella]